MIRVSNLSPDSPRALLMQHHNNFITITIKKLKKTPSLSNTNMLYQLCVCVSNRKIISLHLSINKQMLVI